MEIYREDDKTAYYVSEFGEVWSYRKKDGRWHELKPMKNNGGYLQFICCQNGKMKHILVHRAVYETFRGPIPPGLQINHLNCKRDDNRLSNLELVTPSGNNLHPPTRENMREAHRWQMKRVLDVTTGLVYESAMEAARQLGLRQGNISACCNGRYSQTGGHVFRYAS